MACDSSGKVLPSSNRQGMFSVLDGRTHAVSARWRVMLLGLTLWLNVIGLLYPQQLDGVNHVAEMLRLVSSYITPIAFLVVLFLAGITCVILNGKSDKVVGFSVLAVLCFWVSALVGGVQLKNISVSIFFLVASLVIFAVYGKEHLFSDAFPEQMTRVLCWWATLPVALALHPDFRDYFVDDFENSFHGFASSRIGYGLWGAMLVVLLWRLRPFGYWGGAMMVVLIGLYLSQSRSAVVGLSVAYGYAVIASSCTTKDKLAKLVLIALTAGIIMWSWGLFGRQEPFQMINSTRGEISAKYLELIRAGDYWWGRGNQVSVVLADGAETQAHNLLLQWIVNWGVIGTIALSAFLVAVWLRLRSSASKMLFLVWLTFSMTQPMQGTANFFSPITLIWFFVIVGIDGRAES